MTSITTYNSFVYLSSWISNSKMKIERTPHKFWMHHHSPHMSGKLSSNLGKKSGILLLRGCCFTPRFPNTRTLPDSGTWLASFRTSRFSSNCADLRLVAVAVRMVRWCQGEKVPTYRVFHGRVTGLFDFSFEAKWVFMHGFSPACR